MDMLRKLNDAVCYMEENLCGEMNFNVLAGIACMSEDGFGRLFNYMSGMTIKEYMRCRRLTLAAYDLRDSDMRVIDVAVKYGYNSADAFAKAFIKQHGITPTQARNPHHSLKVYPPASFYIMVKGAKEMDFKVMEVGEEGIMLCGLSKQFTGAAAERFGQEQIMWSVEEDDYTKKIAPERFGTWYGIWDAGRYWIAKAEGEADQAQTEKCKIPAGTYAVFSTEYGGYAGAEIPKLRELIFDSWLPDSGYVQTCDYEVEVYYLSPKSEKAKRHYEIWIPVKRL